MAAGGNPSPQLPQALQSRPVQIGIAIAVVVILLVGSILFFSNASKNLGTYKTLLTGIDQGRALEIVAELKTKGLETEIIPAETGGVEIQVREKQYDTAVLEMAKSDLLLTDDFKLFDKSDWASSDYEKRVKYMRAVGGELSRLVSRMEGVRWGKVHVTIPPEKLFTSRYLKERTSASITIETEPGRTLSNSQVSSILSMVSGYVPDIEPNRISITDTKGRVYASAYIDDESNGGIGLNSNLASQNQTASSNIQRRVQDYLDSMLGAGKSNVAISLKLASQKTTKNITTFSPGAIGTHEYSEEALGDAASSAPYVGMAAQNAPPPREVNNAYGYPQSQGMDLVDPRLQKDMPGNRTAGSLQDEQVRNQNQQMPPQMAAPLNGQSQPYAYPDPSKQPSPYAETNGLYAMGNQGGVPQNAQSMTPPQDPTRYTCAPNDEACKRNYRKHNFAIQSYPSYEQTMIESPAGAIQEIKVSVVVEKGSLPVSIGQLKAGIAAAADPSIDPNSVEVVLRPPMPGKEKEAKNKMLFFGNSEDGSFQWWWIPLGLLVFFVIFLLFRGIGSLLVGKPKTFRDKVPYPSPAPRPNTSPSPNPFDRLDNFEPKPRSPEEESLQTNTRTNVPPSEPYQPTAPAPGNFDEDFQMTPPTPSPKRGGSDLPFDLDDEFADKAPEETKTVRQPNIRPQRQKPTVIIEDDRNAQ